MNILKGYLFHKDEIFNEYVNTLYNIKSNTNKSDPMYLIVKLLLNSLYGRFGMNLSIFYQKQLVIHEDELEYYINRGSVLNYIELDDNKVFITFKDDHNMDNDILNNSKQNISNNISIPIASAITAKACEALEYL